MTAGYDGMYILERARAESQARVVFIGFIGFRVARLSGPGVGGPMVKTHKLGYNPKIMVLSPPTGTPQSRIPNWNTPPHPPPIFPVEKNQSPKHSKRWCPSD